jgi:Domain of unknown function (DUF397)
MEEGGKKLGLEWRKASRSVGNGACIEVATYREGVVVRDSTISDSSPIISFSGDCWEAFLGRIKSR